MLVSIIRGLMILLVAVWRALPLAGAGVGYLVFSPPFISGAIMAGLMGGIGWGVKTLSRQLVASFGARPSHGSARFARKAELAAAGHFKPEGVLLGRKHGRMIRFSGAGHLLTFAPTRSGKGVGCVIPNLLSWPGSVVVTDIKGENLAITGTYRRTLGAVHALAPFVEGGSTSCYNPMDFIRAASPYELDDARLIAEMLVVPEGATPNHWEREARTLITGLLIYVRRESPVLLRNLGHLRDLLMQDADNFELTLQNMASCEQPAARRIATGFSQKDVKERSAVVSTAQAALAVFDSPQLSRMTERSDFRLEDLKETATSLYIVIPPEYLEAYRPFLRLMTGLAAAAMTRAATRPEHDVLFLLDELPTLGYMRPIEDGIGYLAGYGVKLWLFVQDLDQLETIYPKARSMVANCAVRQAFNVQDPATARLLSDMLGTQTVPVRSSGQASPLPLNLLPLSFYGGTSETARPLLTPDEVMALARDTQLLFIEGLRGTLARKLRYYSLREWQLGRRASSP